MASKKCLNYGYDYFTDITRQIAYKRFVHKKFWNVVLHAITSVLVVWCAFYLLSYIFPNVFMHINLISILVLCMVQDLHLGLAACLVYPVLYYHAMYVSTASFLQICCLGVLTYLIQSFIGQQWIEDVDAKILNTIKSEEVQFEILDGYNEIFLSLFHNMTTLLIRLNLRYDLHEKSDVALRQILDRMKKTP